ARRRPPRHPCQRGGRHGGRDRHAAGPVRLPVPGRAAGRHPLRPAPMHRLPAQFPAAGRVLRTRRGAARGDGMPSGLIHPALAEFLLPLALLLVLTLAALGGTLLVWWDRAVRRRRRRYRRVIESTGRKAKATPIAEAEAFRPAKRHGGGSPLGRLLATPAALRRRAERAGLSLGLLP